MYKSWGIARWVFFRREGEVKRSSDVKRGRAGEEVYVSPMTNVCFPHILSIS